MLEIYANTQESAYRTLSNAIKNNKCSHAYLIEGEKQYAFDFAMTFVKDVLLSANEGDDEEVNNIILQVDSGNYTEIKIIEASGVWIKKEQLLDLQHEFSRKALVCNNRIYLIKDAEKINDSSANTILKFLEEPTEEIMAILIANKSSQVISTIVSRCQVIKLGIPEDAFVYFLARVEDNRELYDETLRFIVDYENMGYESIINHVKLKQILSKKENLAMFFEFLQDIYSFVLSIKLKREIKLANSEVEILENIAQKNKVDVIINKINQILTLNERIRSNVNVDLLIDKLIFRMDGGTNV